jgi:Secretion system C-terminal sorting domain
MKYLLFTVSFVELFFYAESQTRLPGTFHSISSHSNSISTRSLTDTLLPLSFVPVDEGGLGCSTGIYPANGRTPDSGYVSGNNQYGDREMAQFMSISKFTNDSEQHFLQQVLVNFGLKTVDSFPENIVVNIYSADSNQIQPAHLIAISNPVNLSEINVQQWTSFSFPETVTLPDSFFMSVQLPSQRGDTLAILTSQDPCRQFPNWSLVKWKDSTWHSIYNTWILDIDFDIATVIEFGITGIKNISDNEEASLFPNPANDYSVLNLKNGKISAYELMDESGKILVHQKFENGQENNSMKISLENFPKGFYLVRWESDRRNGVIPLVKN